MGAVLAALPIVGNLISGLLDCLSGDKKAQAELRKNPKVAAIIEQIKAERGPDDDGLGEDLLNELDD